MIKDKIKRIFIAGMMMSLVITGNNEILVQAAGNDQAVENEMTGAEAEWKVRDSHNLSGLTYHTKESAHFRILWGDERPSTQNVKITDEMVQGNLDHLESIRDFYVNEMGLQDIGLTPWDKSKTQRYKCNVYISDTGLGSVSGNGWAYVNTDSQGYAFMVLSQNAMSVSNPQSTVLPHETAHVFVHHQGGTCVWDWNEPIADFFSNEWQKNAAAFKDGPSTIGFEPFVKNTEWRYPSEKKWYEIWPIFTYIYENPDHITGLGPDGIRKLLKDGKDSDKSYYHKIERVTGVEIEKILCGTIRRLVTMDFDKQELYQSNLKKYKSNMYTTLESTDDGWMKVPDAKAPQQTGYNIIPLSIDLSKGYIDVNLQGTSTSADAGYRASIVTVTKSGKTRYSDMWSGGINAMNLRGDEKEAYLVVVALPKELKQITVYNGSTVDTSDTERYPYKVKITRGSESNTEYNAAQDAVVKADYSNTNTSVTKVNDGTLANDSSSTTWNSWCKDANKTYPYPITMEWDKKQSLSGMEVMWWADDAEAGTASGDGVMFPKNCEVQYYDEASGSYKKITGMTDENNMITDQVGVKYGTETQASDKASDYLLGKNRYWNIVTFPEKIETTKLRLLVTKPDKADAKSGIGIGEWQVFGESASILQGDNIAPEGTVKADYSNTNTSTLKVNDKILANDSSSTTWNTWCKDGNKTYPYPVSIEWDREKTISGMRVMWWADDAETGTASGDGVLFPAKCTVQYYDER